MSRAWRPLMLWMALAAVSGATRATEPPRPDWLDALRAHRIEVRDRALADLPQRLLDPDALATALDAAHVDPEIAMRLRAAVAAAPYLAPSLARVALGPESPAKERARELFVELLTAEIARRAPLDRLLKRSERTTLFMAGDYVGALPPLERAVSFERGVAWMAANGGWSVPIALDPQWGGERLPALTPDEWWPSTAGGMLKRWLSLRNLEIVDLGIVTVISTNEVARAFERSEFDSKDSNRRRFGFERRAADWLTTRLLAPERDPAAVAARLRLWIALGLPPTGCAAFESDRAAVPELWLRAVLERVEDPSEALRVANSITSGSREVRAAILFELGRGSRAHEALERVLARECGAFAISYLECKRRAVLPKEGLFEPFTATGTTASSEALAAFASADPARIDRAVAWIEASTRQAADFDLIAVASGWMRSASAYDCGLLDRLLRSPNEAARSIGFYGLGVRAARGEPIGRQRVSSTERRAFLLGLAFGDIGRPTPLKSAMVSELAFTLATDPDAFLLASVRAIDTPRALANVESLRRADGDRLRTARALVHRSVIDLIEDDDRLATRLLFELRNLDDDRAVFAPLYDDASAAFSSDDRGRVSLVEPIDRLWLTD